MPHGDMPRACAWLQMFGPDAPPLEWDEKGEYSRSKVELYYLAHAGKELSKEQLVSAMEGRWPAGLAEDEGGPNKYGERAARMRRVDAQSTLAQASVRLGGSRCWLAGSAQQTGHAVCSACAFDHTEVIKVSAGIGNASAAWHICAENDSQ